ncbi:hypothetical protein VTK73DRAFT_500 [Phialemonium thermophilum]|uniref:Uncharacterized protein n=1 Tax=Phialemonium thermophilum TaxID=223376 RepID=A0ABR3VUT4_9PEZI
MQKAYCACVISNLEGFKGVPSVVYTGNAQVTLDELDKRAQRLENMTTGVVVPPPPVLPTWDALAWRVARLASVLVYTRTLGSVALPGTLYGSWELLDRIVTHIECLDPIPVLKPSERLARSQTTRPVATAAAAAAASDGSDKHESDDEKLLVVTQRLCYAAGKRRIHIRNAPTNLDEACLFGMDLSIEMEKTRLGAHAAPPFHGMHHAAPPGPWDPRNARPRVPPSPRRDFRSARRARSSSSSSSGSSGLSVRLAARRRGGRWGRVKTFFRKLACWKTSPGDASDSGSDSSSTICDS